MKQIPIEEIIIDAENRLLIRPEFGLGDNYEYIYRDASGVTWIAQLGCLGAREPEKWNHFDLFRQIILAVQGEYRELLTVTPETKCSNVSSVLESQIKEWKQNNPFCGALSKKCGFDK